MSRSEVQKYLVLRSTVEAQCPPPSTILVTSAMSCDGKTTVAAGLAKSLANSGYRTLAVDAGATPHLARALDASELPAVSSLAFDEEEKPMIRLVGNRLDAVSLARADVAARSHAEFDEFFAELRHRYEFVVVDGGELLGSAAALARAVNAIILTVRRGRAATQADRDVALLLARLDAPILGVVETSAKRSPAPAEKPALAGSAARDIAAKRAFAVRRS
jgi:Mrp family chromosome partitioning ATPase